MHETLPTLVASDLEGVLAPEIWIAVAHKTGIEQLLLTTRDVADYDELMRMRLRILAEHNLTLGDLHAVIATLDPLPGALGLMRWLRERTRFIILTDSYYEFLTPLLPKLEFPTIFAHSLQTDGRGRIIGYQLRVPNSKRQAVRAFQELGFRTLAVGDSYNDTAMLGVAEQGILFRPPANVIAEFPQFPVTGTHLELQALIEKFLDPAQS